MLSAALVERSCRESKNGFIHSAPEIDSQAASASLTLASVPPQRHTPLAAVACAMAGRAIGNVSKEFNLWSVAGEFCLTTATSGLRPLPFPFAEPALTFAILVALFEVPLQARPNIIAPAAMSSYGSIVSTSIYPGQSAESYVFFFRRAWAKDLLLQGWRTSDCSSNWRGKSVK